MGHAEHHAKAKREQLLSLPIRILKGLTGMLLSIPLVVAYVGIKCFEDNEWPWERFLDS